MSIRAVKNRVAYALNRQAGNKEARPKETPASPGSRIKFNNDDCQVQKSR